MEIGQPCEIHRFTFKSHTVGHLSGNSQPAQPPTRSVRQRAPAVNGFDVTHDGKITLIGYISNNYRPDGAKAGA